MTSPETSGHRRQHLLVASAFLAIAVMQTWPLITELSTVLPNDLGDPVLNAWILWWNAHSVPLTTSWWNAPIFYPSPGAISFSEVLLGLSLFASPLQWLGATPICAYNLLFLTSFALCAFGAYLLAWSLTLRAGPSIVAGVMYGFAVMRYPHISHIQFQWTWWMPLALLGLHRWVIERRVSGLILFAGAWVGQTLSNGYYFFYFSVIVVLWIAWFTPWHQIWRRDARRVLIPVLAVWAVGLAIVSPVLIGYQRFHERYQFTRSIEEIDSLSADLTDFIRLSSVARFLHVEPWERAECQVSLPVLGLCALAVAIVSGARGGLRRRQPRLFSIAHGIAWAVAIALALAIVGALLLGKRHVYLFRHDFGSVARLIATVIPLVLVLLAFSPTAVRAWRTRSASAFYLGGVFVSIVLAMGPFPRAFGLRIWSHSPYLLLMSFVPGFTGLRVPARFALVALLCLAILTALVLARLQFTRVWRERLVFGAIVAALLFETWPGNMRIVDLPPAGPDLRSASVVMELPFDAGQGLNAMYRATLHGRPILGGYSGYFPPAAAVLAVCIRRADTMCLDRLRRVVGPIDMVIERQRDRSGQLEELVRGLPNAEFRARDPRFVVYHLPGRATLSTQPQATSRLVDARVENMTASVDGSHARAAFDRDWDTVWSTGRGQEIDDSVTLTIAGGAALIGGLELQSGPANPQDFPVGLRVEVSEDGQRWTRAWEGPTDDVRFATLLLDGINGSRITFPPQRGRFVRLTETVNESARAWTIAELTVLRVP